MADTRASTPLCLDPTGWRSWHLHLSTLDASAGDRVVRDVVGPVVGETRGTPGVGWFFLRYWQEGPHIRLRMSGVDAASADRLERHLRHNLRQVMAATPAPLTADGYRRNAAPLAAAGEGGEALEVGELRPAGVYRRPYRPEADRFGGLGLLALSESLFQVSSELSLAFLRRHPPESARSGLAFQATRAALGVLGDEERRRAFCRRARAGWQAWASRAEGVGKDPARLVVPPLRGIALPSPLGALPPPVRRWVEQLGGAMGTWRHELGEARAQRILHSHIHLLHNRLGLSVGQESNHYWVLAEAPVLEATP